MIFEAITVRAFTTLLGGEFQIFNLKQLICFLVMQVSTIIKTGTVDYHAKCKNTDKPVLRCYPLVR